LLCLAASDGERLQQLAAVLAVGGQAVWPPEARPLRDLLTAPAHERVTLAQDRRGEAAHFDAILHWSGRRPARAAADAGRATRRHRRRHLTARRRGAAAGAPDGRALAERQHRSGGWQCLTMIG
jgi:hypothetical protein